MGLGRGIKEIWLAGSEAHGGQGRGVVVGAREEDVKAVLEGLGRLLGER